jgi:type IV pilus assembly protein PilB
MEAGKPRRAAVSNEAVVAFLADSELFRGVDRPTVERIAPHVFAADVPKATTILRAGSPNPGIGVVFSGRVVVRDGASVLEELTVGGTFGESGAFGGSTQPHDVVAVDDSIVLLLGHDLVEKIAPKVAAFSYAAARRLATRQTAAPRARSSTLSAPLGDAAVRFVRVSSYEPTPQVLAMVPAQFIHQHRALPLELRDKTLVVGMVDPLSTSSRTELARVLPTLEVEIVAIAADDFNEAFVRLRLDSIRPRRGTRPPDQQVQIGELTFDLADQERDAKSNVIGDDIVALASRIIAYAIDRGASDVHIDIDVTGPRVRFRVQGALFDWDTVVPTPFAKGLIARFKVLAGLDVTERRLPQDGRIGVRVGRREVDIRVSTIPSSRGEKVALRVFEAASMLRPLETIFHIPRVLDAVRAAIQRPYGAIVVAGPTGSGKTTSLYAALGERKRSRSDTNILTVEDPIEYRLAGVTQIQVNHAVDLTFAKVLRAMLRQDPDAIMIGEIRDDDTAQLALEAAMTGHLVFTSVHANDAVGTIQRLENLSCGRPLIGQSLALVIVQRLARKLCPRCTINELPPRAMIDNLAAHGLVDPVLPQPLPRGVGCNDCNQTGHAGRIAVTEMLSLDDALRAQIMSGASLTEIERTATQQRALVSFRASAVHLMNKQAISPSEALLMLT